MGCARQERSLDGTVSEHQIVDVLIRDDLEVNGKSIMGVMMLAAEFGSTILVRTEGPDADAALDALEALVAAKFGES